jgi:O-antigen ligase
MLALAAVLAVMLWKFRKRHRAIPYVAGLLMTAVLLLGAPGGLGDRLWTIIRPNSDGTGSAQERRDNLKRGVIVFARNPITGIGIGTFHIVGIRERRAHNSYLEIGAELGVFALLAYLVMIFYPLKALWRIEQQTLGAKDKVNFQNYLLAVALQGTLTAYYVNSFFASIQYLWFVYYPLAYAIALRRIYEREEILADAVAAPPQLAQLHVGDDLKGTLWRDRQKSLPHAATVPPSPVSET